jgi:hypothetical protein
MRVLQQETGAARSFKWSARTRFPTRCPSSVARPIREGYLQLNRFHPVIVLPLSEGHMLRLFFGVSIDAARRSRRASPDDILDEL